MIGVLFGLSADAYAHSTISGPEELAPALSSWAPRNETIKILAIHFDQAFACIWCAEGKTREPGRGCDGNDNVVAVSVKTNRPLKKSESIRYEVTGGEVEVDDGKATWTLPQQAGTFEITASVVSKGGVLSTLSKTIENRFADCGIDHECPTIGIRSPVSELKAGEAIDLEAVIVGGDQRNANLEWSVTGASILSGKNEHIVRIRIPEGSVKREIVVSLSVTFSKGLCDSQTSQTIRIVGR